jgi:hypothetical protein
MSYPSDGRNHHQSIQVEKSMSSYKSEYEKYYGKIIDRNIDAINNIKQGLDNVTIQPKLDL